MQKITKEMKDLLFPYEVLRARFDIRDFFLRMIVKQIYENTGQTLSLVRMQMSDAFVIQNLKTAASGKLLEQTIKDLRSMSKNLFPDEVLLPDHGLAGILEVAANKIFPDRKVQFIAEQDVELEEATQLIIGKIILDVLTSVKKKSGFVRQLLIAQNDEIACTISYQCEDDSLFENNDQNAPYLSIEQRLELLNGCFIKKTIETGYYQIILQLPKTR